MFRRRCRSDRTTASQSGDDSARFTLSKESPVTSDLATVTSSNTDHSDLTEPVIIEERPLDYSHIGIIADDPAFRWYAIQCAPNSEEKLVKALEVQLADQHLKQHVPVILFPYMLRRTLERQRLVERKLPLIIEGYIFVLMRPETHLGRFLNDKGVRLPSCSALP